MKFPHNLDPFNTKHLFQFLDKHCVRGAPSGACAARCLRDERLSPGAAPNSMAQKPKGEEAEKTLASTLFSMRQCLLGCFSIFVKKIG